MALSATRPADAANFRDKRRRYWLYWSGNVVGLIYILDVLSVTRPSERDLAFHTYLAVVAILVLYSLIRIVHILKYRKKAYDDGVLKG